MPQFKPSDSVKPSLDLTNTDAEALDVTGGAEFGSGNVELIGVDGKINGPLSSSIIDNLDGSNLTGVVATTLSATLAVNKGGTGADTLTDGGVLLGSGTGAVTPMAVLADGEVIVGDGSGDPVAESGATLRTSIGLGTGDSPQFDDIELGHASDTTIARASAGNVTIEGNEIYRAGGTDVPVSDGGTGVGTLTDGGVLLGSGTNAITAMAVLADGEMIVGDGTTDPVAESGSTLRTSIGCDAAGNITSGTVGTARLGSGTASSGTFLRGDSSWAAAGGGKVLQVVAATHASQASSTSNSLADTGLTAAITPAGTGSKILVYGGMNGCRKDGSEGLGLALCEDIGGAGYSCFQNTFDGLGGYDAGSGVQLFGGVGFGALRSPSTTSACTYKVQLKATLNSGTVYTNQSNGISWIVLMEIGA
jgi:hypothetical protein